MELNIIIDYLIISIIASMAINSLLRNLAKEKQILIDLPDKSKGILLTGLPNSTDFSDSSLIEYVKDFQNWRKVRMIGSAAMAAAFVASGKVDVYKEKGTFLWDVAAGAAILNSAGGNASIINQKENFQIDVFFSNSKILDNTWE